MWLGVSVIVVLVFVLMMPGLSSLGVLGLFFVFILLDPAWSAFRFVRARFGDGGVVCLASKFAGASSRSRSNCAAVRQVVDWASSRAFFFGRVDSVGVGGECLAMVWVSWLWLVEDGIVLLVAVSRVACWWLWWFVEWAFVGVRAWLNVSLLLWGYLGVVWWVLGRLGVFCVCIGVHSVVVLWLLMCLLVLSLVRCVFFVFLFVLMFSVLFVVGFRWCGWLVL